MSVLVPGSKLSKNKVCMIGIPADNICVNVSCTGQWWFEQKAVKVLSVRDTVVKPFSVEEFVISPLRKMSRYLLTFRDLETRRRIRVFEKNLEGRLRDCPLRVGIFDSGVIVELLATNWGPTMRDRAALVEFLRRFQNSDFGELELGIFSDDGEVIC